MAGALADVMKQQADKAQSLKDAEAERKKPKKTSPVTWVLFAVLSVISAYVWIGSPEWLESGPAPVPPALAEAGLRMEVFEHALLVNDYLAASGRLPRDLSEAGIGETNVAYARVDEVRYRLELTGPLGSVQYDSDEPLDVFVGDALQVIRQGG
jgi:hypothetical protein